MGSKSSLTIGSDYGTGKARTLERPQPRRGYF